jgi:methylphosphotriester-DNA--protein-cysteine methyltransferase
MIEHANIEQTDLIQLIKSGKIVFGGNKNLKIYGLLTCKSGKRMKRENRVFFAYESEALALGYRPCGSCMNKKYKEYARNTD